jgi:hypothetical protein
MQNRLHENGGKKHENFNFEPARLLFRSQYGSLSRVRSKSAGGFAVSSLSDI